MYTVSYLSPFSSLSVSILEAPLNRQSYRNGRRSGECKTGVGGIRVPMCGLVCASVWTSGLVAPRGADMKFVKLFTLADF